MHIARAVEVTDTWNVYARAAAGSQIVRDVIARAAARD
jgi:hypothetical protein